MIHFSPTRENMPFPPTSALSASNLIPPTASNPIFVPEGTFDVSLLDVGDILGVCTHGVFYAPKGLRRSSPEVVKLPENGNDFTCIASDGKNTIAGTSSGGAYIVQGLRRTGEVRVKELKDTGLLSSVFGFLGSAATSSSSSSSSSSGIRGIEKVGGRFVVMREGGAREILEVDFGKATFKVVSR